jgi:hypothetical protein
MITTIKLLPTNPVQSRFAVFKDKEKDRKSRIVLMFLADDNKNLYVLGECGILRRWNLS